MKVKLGDGLSVPGEIDPADLKKKLKKFIDDSQELTVTNMKYKTGDSKFKVFYSIGQDKKGNDEATINRIESQ